jgi:ribosomal protein S18 acetylase RimI-like enzyme
MTEHPRLIAPDDPALAQVLTLIRDSFAYMDGVIDPPSSMHRLTLADLQGPEVWAMGAPPVACVVLTPKPDCLYLGKLAVAKDQRGQGHARRLVGHALNRARDLGLPAVELQVRVELTGNQAAFAAMGFVETARTAHAGHDRPTSITYRRAV